ncbi:MarR family winged helix-turn-helix transcriptional regulator [Paraburkholderia phytofirmans]|uniref:Transcriptional regulator, MarR family n=1 Tax=Paraburkholderia phytofirmans (strain DSM 17436 / LMG 22146 / PsJN) TaxID=398527 RepID=B2T4E8_PARPJ|nr:MarR family transcriptional regulator [Paraburkholderia phytofirmans]ACD16459.1 transcriptional regulator, MarR family [Paraburkholderia phytofirmans PsJN]
MSHTPTAPGAADEPRLKHPSHIDEFLLYRLHNLTRVAVQGVGLMFRREIGISRRDWRVLAFVGRFPDLNLTRLAELTGLDTVIASRCVTQLVQRGLLANRRQPANKRVSLLRLTESGEQVYAQAHAAGQQYNIEFAACLNDDEARLLETVMSKLEARAHELNQREIAFGVDSREGDSVEE